MRNVFIKALDEVDLAVKAKQKAKDTKAFTARLPKMQNYVGMSKEKRALLMKVIKQDGMLEGGVVVFERMVEVANVLIEDLEKEGIDCALINSKLSQKGRLKASDWFMESPSNKVVVITEAGAESVSLHSTRNLILYSCPNGPGKYTQTIGRVCRDFGKFNDFNIHFIVVEDTLDEYKQILLSSKKELEMEILHSDTIQVKNDMKSFDLTVLKKLRQRMLWKTGKLKRKPKGI